MLVAVDYLELNNVAFEWAESYDTKDWDRLQRALGPSVRLDFRCFGGQLHESLSPKEYAGILIGVIGDKRLATQHHIGGSRWVKMDDGTVQAWHQLRVAHLRYSDENLSTVINHGHGHGVVHHGYKKIDGTWKLVMVAPDNHFSEYDLMGTVSGDFGNGPTNAAS